MIPIDYNVVKVNVRDSFFTALGTKRISKNSAGKLAVGTKMSGAIQITTFKQGQQFGKSLYSDMYYCYSCDKEKPCHL